MTDLYFLLVLVCPSACCACREFQLQESCATTDLGAHVSKAQRVLVIFVLHVVLLQM